jgi:CheY-like chemotaxis protein
VVDDDSSVATVICAYLRSEGRRCVCVRTDKQAYQKIPGEPPLTALVIDINLGAGTTGFDVARFARQLIPDLRVVYMSGETRPDAFKTFGVAGSAFLSKPFTMAELQAALEPPGA